jgi:hypothetical protein
MNPNQAGSYLFLQELACVQASLSGLDLTVVKPQHGDVN